MYKHMTYYGYETKIHEWKHMKIINSLYFKIRCYYHVFWMYICMWKYIRYFLRQSLSFNLDLLDCPGWDYRPVSPSPAFTCIAGVWISPRMVASTLLTEPLPRTTNITRILKCNPSYLPHPSLVEQLCLPWLVTDRRDEVVMREEHASDAVQEAPQALQPHSTETSQGFMWSWCCCCYCCYYYHYI